MQQLCCATGRLGEEGPITDCALCQPWCGPDRIAAVEVLLVFAFLAPGLARRGETSEQNSPAQVSKALSINAYTVGRSANVTRICCS